MDDLGRVRLDQLTAEMAWIRRIARALCTDASTADDIAQETWLAAAGNVPEDRPLRPWLARVMTNVVRMRFRGEQRRSAREEATERPDDVATAAQLIDRVEVQRVVAGEVLALAEPYRSTVLLHYFEGLSSAEIARRHGIPDGTVRRRLKTALDELRRRLGARDDRRGGWLAALAPLATWKPSPALTAWGMAMKKIVIAVVMLAFIVVGALLWKRGRGDDDAKSGAAQQAARSGAAHTASHAGATSARDPVVHPWLAQANVPDRKIAGRVTFDGAPLAGATVRLAGITVDLPTRPGAAAPSREIATATTGADGRFDFGARPAANWLVSAEAADKTPASVWLGSASPSVKPDQIELELGDCRSHVSGSVVDSSGGGIPNARLTVAGAGGVDASSTGEYALCVPVGDFTVRVEADGYGAIEQHLHSVGGLRHDFELVPESVLVGRVVDEANHAIANARVIALPDAMDGPHHTAVGTTIADAEGKFRIENLAPGTFQLAAASDGVGTPATKRVVATPGTSAKEVTLVVTRRARVTGKVVMNNQPVAGARVRFDPQPVLAFAAFSQDDGSFTLDGVPFGTLKLAVGPYELVSQKTLVVDKPAIDGLTLEVTELASLAGTITRQGKPVPGATVACGPVGGASDSEGKYILRGLSPGKCGLFAQETAKVFAFAPPKPVMIEAGKHAHADVELVGGATAKGVVVDEQGKPVPHVYVRMIAPTTGDLGESATDDEGRFECTTMAGDGDYRISVYPSPAAQIAFKPAKGEQEVVAIKDGNTHVTSLEIAIKYEQLAIAGRIVDDTGAPVSDVHVEALGTVQGGGGANGMLPSARADANGQFAVRNLARGFYNVHAHAADGSEAEIMHIAAGTKDLVVKLVRPGAIEGTFTGFSSVPVIRARTLTADLSMGNDGIIEGNKFTISGLTPGKYAVEATAGDQRDAVSVVVKSGVTTPIELQARNRGKLTARVMEFGTNKPIPTMNCLAAMSVGGQATTPDGQQTTPTDAKGVATLTANVGKVRVMCFSPDGAFSAAGGDTDVTANGVANIDLFSVKPLPPPSDLGFRITPITLPLTIAQVDPQGPAQGSGLQAGDKLVSIDGTPVAGLLPIGAMMLAWNHRPNTTLTLGVDRAGTSLTVKIVVAKQAN
jgi:RNA polymerase sigma factor (sigma-70 family)